MSVVVKTYTEPPFDEKEVLRYAGCKTADEQVRTLLLKCWEEAKDKLSYKLCFLETELSITETGCEIGGFYFPSKRLQTHLKDCKKAVIFCASLGVELDRLIGKYARLSPSKAVLLQAIGAERVEALCDAFCKELQEGNINTTARFSPGYGDLPLDTQKTLLSMLNAEKYIGVYLNNSMLMFPTKSVTAIVGIF